jgi:CRISPR-associated endonuclease Csn1
MAGEGSMEVRLGIDLGPNSVGWSLVKYGQAGAQEVIATGASAFEAGLDELEKDGKGKSRNAARRDARLHRRMLWRHRRRLRHLAHMLQQASLLPEGELRESEQRNSFFTSLDQRLDNPYLLRKRALEERLEPFEIGRAFYHLCQRRGFKSGRLSAPKDDEERGKVKKGIGELEELMKKAGARTYGEYFAGVDPRERRIRTRCTSRQKYEDEFKLIWETQTQHYPAILHATLRKTIHKTIFDQRPLKSQKSLIGECELERGRKRAPWALLDAQRFRYLQKVNDLMIADRSTGEVRPLTDDERTALIAECDVKAEVTFAGMRKMLKLGRKVQFNLEEGGEKKIPGNRTASRLIEIFGADRWISMSKDDRDAVVEDLRSIVKDETLKRRAMNKWELDEEQALRICDVTLEPGYCNFSRQAIVKLLPRLEKGESLQTVIRELYPERWERTGEPQNLLPPVDSDEMPDVRNPIVVRALTELRHVVNAVIHRYGKPDRVHIELARELRQTAEQRGEAAKRSRANENERKAAAKKILDECGIENPSRRDIEKVLLAEECAWECSYTGKRISMDSLLGQYPQFDIEHIVPFERSLDDSYVNKTLCDVDENRNVKRKHTPFEVYSHDPDRWAQILSRVEKFSSRTGREKLRRFKFTTKDVEDFAADFTSRQLNDTRYAARLAKQYLGLLYGGVKDDGIDASGKRRVLSTPGKVTAYLRWLWGLNSILGDGDTKSRDDHRHHAVDAIVVALTDQAAINMLSNASKRGADLYERRKFDDVPQPWEGFHSDVERAIKGIVTAHRVSRRARGALHKETFYGRPRKDEKGKEYVHTRCRLDELGASDVENIVDNRVRELVIGKLAKLGEIDPKKAFADESNRPVYMMRDGIPLRINKTVIRRNLVTFEVGKGCGVRHVQSDTNHHMEVFAVLDKDGNVKKWDAEVVSMLEAYRRKKAGEPIVRRDLGPDRKFVLSLAGGEIIELDDGAEKRLYRIRTVPQSKQIYFAAINDARTLKDMGKKGLTAMPGSLQERHCRKCVVTPLGEVRYAND